MCMGRVCLPRVCVCVYALHWFVVVVVVFLHFLINFVCRMSNKHKVRRKADVPNIGTKCKSDDQIGWVIQIEVKT